MSSPFDHLKLASDKKALKALVMNSAGNDQIIFSMKMIKINRKGKGQNRVLLITNRHIFNLMPDNFSKCNRCMNIRQLHHLTISSAGKEFVIHLTDDYDYRFSTPFYEQAVKCMREAYAKLTGSELAVTEVSDVDALAQQVMTKAAVKKGGSWGLPTPSGKEAAGAASPQGGGSGSRPGFAAVSPSGKFADDDADSDGDDGLREESVTPRAMGCGGAPEKPPVMAGGAFNAKSKYTVDDFTVLKVLGKGAFGKVMLAKANDSGVIYAMKALSKAQLIEKNEVVHTKTERRALSDTHHPFLVHLRFAFQTPTKLYLVMDYCNGGELFFHLKQAGRFAEPRAKLYAAEIASALQHLHSLKIIYRDLKPENVLLDAEGHVRITDFGLAKDAMELDDKTHTFCGTPDYLAPEVIKGEGHGRGVDWWSLGTMIYEMLGGLPPFYSENFNVMYERILRAPLEFRPAEVFKADAKDLIAGMLQKEPELRTGSSEEDGNELRRHPWFASIDWVKLEKRELPTPFKPNVTNELDVSNFDEEFTTQAVESVVPDMTFSDPRAAKSDAFDGFTYVDTNHLNVS